VVERISVPIRLVGQEKWADLGAIALSHEIVAEVINLENQFFSFAGGHRVRRLRARKSVHFLVPTGAVLDIASVPAGPPPRRNQRNSGTGKKRK
jgi:hypothetical protein